MAVTRRQTFHIETEGMEEMEADFERASLPNYHTKSITKLDNLLHASAAAVRSRVHIDTGYLISSGRSDSHFVNDLWIGEIRYAAHPGIYELARGDKPTGDPGLGFDTKREAKAHVRLQHPTGGHFFFNAVEPFIPQMQSAIEAMFDDYFSKARV